MEQNLTRIFTLFGGLALFLYGMDALSHSLETAAGSRLKSLLAAVTGSPVRGVLAGAAVTAVLQSSSAVTVMVIAFLAAGLLQLRQAVPVVFGANIGNMRPNSSPKDISTWWLPTYKCRPSTGSGSLPPSAR